MRCEASAIGLEIEGSGRSPGREVAGIRTAVHE